MAKKKMHFKREENSAQKFINLVKSGRVKVYTPYKVREILMEDDSLKICGDYKGESLSIDGIDELIVNTGPS